MVEQIISLFGAAMILFAYAAQQLKKMKSDQLPYILLNLIGAGILAIVAYRVRQTGLTVLEVSWAGISAVALIRYAQLR
jgi:hypothetical protein